MGYLIVIALSVGLIVLFVAALVRSSGGQPPTGQVEGDRTVEREQPSADEPTPARSGVAPPRQQRRAQRETPPA